MSDNNSWNHEHPPQPPSPFTEPPKKKSKLPYILAIVGGVLLMGGIGVAIVLAAFFNSLKADAQDAPTGEPSASSSEPSDVLGTDEPTPDAQASGGALGDKAEGIYPATWGEAPALPYMTVDETKTDEDVLADLKSKLRSDTFTATDTEILNVTKSFCWAYEKGESWKSAAVEFMILGDKADVDTKASNLAYNVNLMGYAAAHFYCPRYEEDIKNEILEAQKK